MDKNKNTNNNKTTADNSKLQQLQAQTEQAVKTPSLDYKPLDKATTLAKQPMPATPNVTHESAYIYEHERNGTQPRTKEEIDKAERTHKWEQSLAALSDGIASFANLISTANYAPNHYDPSTSASKRVKDNWDKFIADNDKRTMLYKAGLDKAKALDIAEAKTAWQQAKDRYDRGLEADKEAYKRGRDKVKDAQWAIEEENENKRHKERMEVEAKRPRYVGRSRYGAGTRNDKNHVFADSNGNSLSVDPYVWRNNYQRLFDILVDEGYMDTTNSRGEQVKFSSRQRAKMRSRDIEDAVKRYWNKSEKVKRELLNLSNKSEREEYHDLSDYEPEVIEWSPELETRNTTTAGGKKINQYRPKK